MSKITSAKNYDLFIKEACFFYCQDVYEGDWDGKENYIVASDTPEEMLVKKYPEIMEELSPYIFCNASCGRIYAESKRNIDKHRKRSINTLSYGSIEVIDNMLIREDQEMDIMLLLEEGLAVCTPIQRERIKQYYLEGMTIAEIANGRSISNVYDSIVAGLKKIQKFYDIHPKKQGL